MNQSQERLYSVFQECGHISIDSRNILSFTQRQEKVIFFALKGEAFDGNRFAATALQQGAAYVVVDNPNVIDKQQIQQYILVDDTLQALQQLAKTYRQSLSTKILAITGSNGKTTTKELIKRVLSKRYQVDSTIGNLNNHIGVPLTLLSIRPDTEIAIVEMGANHQHEIAFLCSLAMPDYGIITNMGKAHLEGFGGEQGVVKGKSELLDFLEQQHGIVFYNTNCQKLSNAVAHRPGLTCIAYSLDDLHSFSDEAGMLQVSYRHYNPITTHLVGEYNKYNILSAITIGIFFDVAYPEIADAIASFVPNNNRSQLVIGNNNMLIADVYNANPSSMSEALNNFISMPKKGKTVILGDMKELGTYAQEEHQKIVSELARHADIEKIFIGASFMQCRQTTTDPLSFFFPTTESYLDHLQQHPITNRWILVKGSRSMQLEQVVEALE